ncbi:putative protein phosphatase 4 core regulatory subunit R2 [Rosellinia necatrix]|uniref:Uncharacterized protein n=1 Tax=Rosellinia necatrix TaxID=77044 RepID=A0A1S7UQB5_ROSNE|nr:putative protein phosphatase 4 core regulatory subunit R2 [Rosellinia necatrix]
MMEIDDDEILQGLAAGRSMDYSMWPALLPRVIARVEKIALEEFPIPNLPPPPPPPVPLSSAATIPSSLPRAPDSDLPEHFLAPLPSSPTEPRISSPSSDTNKENTPVAPRSTALPPPPTSASLPPPPGALPPQFASMLSEITSSLKSTFPTYPPHTIQRISELVITPKQHYRSLATYLHALDRVVHVTSGLNVYPLPSTHVEVPGGQVNGALETSSRLSTWVSPGSDEALGGALLTPIPWLSHAQRPVTGPSAQATRVSPPRQAQPAASSQEVPAEFEGEVRTESTERIDGPNGVGSIETVSVSVNGIPSMGARGVSVTQGAIGSIHGGNAEDDGKPHARGPEEIGADDLGPQATTSSTLSTTITAGGMRQGIDVQAAVGRKPLDISTSSKSEGNSSDSLDGDKMDVEENGREVRTLTPKRDAGDELGGSVSKKLKDDASSSPGDMGSASTDTEAGSKDNDHGHAMDKN